MASPSALAGDRDRGGFSLTIGSDGFHVGARFGRGRRVYQAPRRHVRPVVRHVVRHVHTRSCTPVYAKVWVPPRYERVVVGRDDCGRPIFRTVCVSAGYHTSVFKGYSCGHGHGSSCGNGPGCGHAHGDC